MLRSSMYCSYLGCVIFTYPSYTQNLDEALKKNSKNTHPYAICIGLATDIKSSVIVCNRKVITEEIGHFVFSVLLALIYMLLRCHIIQYASK